MKRVALIFFLSFAAIFNAQESKFFGKYVGKLDTIRTDDTSRIWVDLTLKENKTFDYHIKGVFTGCTSNEFTCIGEWKAAEGWIYFKPKSNKEGIVVFLLSYPKRNDETSDEEFVQMGKFGKEGYDYALKITDDKPDCPKLFFRISYDCFKQVWKNKCVQKANCK